MSLISRQFLNGVDLASQRITSVASPTSATDAANKAYVDALASGLEWKQEVRAATTTNGTLASAFANGQVVDGYTLVTGDRILIKNQTTQTQNGIYVVQASGAPVLSSDANTTASLNNATVLVTKGTTNANTSWTQTTADPTIGTSNIIFVAYAAGGVYTAAATGGLTVASNAFSVLLPANSGLSTSASGLTVGAGAGISVSGANVAVSLASTSGLNTTSGLAVGAGSGILVNTSTISIDTTVVTRHFATSIGDGSTLTYTVTHNLGTLDVIVQTFNNTGGAQVEADIVHATTNTITAAFAVAPATNAIRVVVMG